MQLVKPNSDKVPSGSGTDSGYTVEARYASHRPEMICGQMLDNRWSTLRFDKAPIGVPSQTWPVSVPGYLSFEAAQALRWWFIAQARADYRGMFCLETRLVRHKIKYSYEVAAEAYVDPLDFHGRVPKDMIAEPQPAAA